MSSVYVSVIEASWEPAPCSQSPVDDTGLLTVPVEPEKVSIAILDLGSCGDGKGTGDAADVVAEEVADRDARGDDSLRKNATVSSATLEMGMRYQEAWASLKEAGFPCLVAVLTSPLPHTAAAPVPPPQDRATPRPSPRDGVCNDEGGSYQLGPNENSSGSVAMLGPHHPRQALVHQLAGPSFASLDSMHFLLATAAATPAGVTVCGPPHRRSRENEDDGEDLPPLVMTATPNAVVGRSRVVCRTVWPLPPLREVPLTMSSMFAHPHTSNLGLTAYTFVFANADATDGSSNRGDGVAVESAAEDAKDQQRSEHAAVSTLLLQLGRWNAALLANLFLRAGALATSAASEAPLSRQPSRQREGGKEDVKTGRDAESRASPSVFLYTMPELLELIFGYWQDRLQDTGAATTEAEAARHLNPRDRPNPEACSPVPPAAALPASAAASHRSSSSPPPPLPQTPTLISRAFFQNVCRAPRVGQPLEVDTLEAPGAMTAPDRSLPLCPPLTLALPSNRTHRISATLVEQLLTSMEFSVAYWSSRCRSPSTGGTGGMEEEESDLAAYPDAPPVTVHQVRQRLRCYALPAISEETPFATVWGHYLVQRMRLTRSTHAPSPASPSPCLSSSPSAADCRPKAPPLSPQQRLGQTRGLSCSAIEVWMLWQRTARAAAAHRTTHRRPATDVAASSPETQANVTLPPSPSMTHSTVSMEGDARSSSSPPLPPSTSLPRACLPFSATPEHLSSPKSKPAVAGGTFATPLWPPLFHGARSAPDVVTVGPTNTTSGTSALSASLPMTPSIQRGLSRLRKDQTTVASPSSSPITTPTSAATGLLHVLPCPLPAGVTVWPLAERAASPSPSGTVPQETARKVEIRAILPLQAVAGGSTACIAQQQPRISTAVTAASPRNVSDGKRVDSWESLSGSGGHGGDEGVEVPSAGAMKSPRVCSEERVTSRFDQMGAPTGDATGAYPRSPPMLGPRPRGGLYSASSFVAVLTASTSRLLGDYHATSPQHQYPPQRAWPLSPFSGVLQSAVPSSSSSSASVVPPHHTPHSACSSSSPEVAAGHDLEMIRTGRLLPSLATLEQLNQLSRYTPVWCYLYDPLTGRRDGIGSRGGGSGGGGDSGHGRRAGVGGASGRGGTAGVVHHRSYLQRYIPSFGNGGGGGASSGSSGGGVAGVGIGDLGRASKAGLAATLGYMAGTARTVFGAMKATVPRKMRGPLRGADGSSPTLLGEDDGKDEMSELVASLALAPQEAPSLPNTFGGPSVLVGAPSDRSYATTAPTAAAAVAGTVSSTSSLSPGHGTMGITRDVTKDPTLYYALCALIITEQDIIIHAVPTVEAQRQKRRAQLKRRQQSHSSGAPAGRGSPCNRERDGNGRDEAAALAAATAAAASEGDDDDDDVAGVMGDANAKEEEEESDDYRDDMWEDAELLLIPRVSLVSVTPCAVDRGAGGVFGMKHAHKLDDHSRAPLPHPGGWGGVEGSKGGLDRGVDTNRRGPSTFHDARRATTLSTTVVLRLQSSAMQTIWLEFATEDALQEAQRLLNTPLSRTEEVGATESRSRYPWSLVHLPSCGNRFLSSARRPWYMVPLVLVAANVLPPGAVTSPFTQAFLRNVTVAAAVLNVQRLSAVSPTAPQTILAPPSASAQLSLSLPLATASSPPPPLSLTLADTWWLFDPVRELVRQGVPEDRWTLTTANNEYAFASTYPSTFVVPTAVARAMERGELDGRHRMSRRVEAMVFYYAPTGGVLVRSAQPTLVSLMAEMPTESALEWTSHVTGGRLGKASANPAWTATSLPTPVPLRDVTPLILDAFAKAAGLSSQQLVVMDLRTGRAALGNVGVGGGTIELLRYPVGGVEYAGLPNIHTLRKAWRRLAASLTYDAPYTLRGEDTAAAETQYVQYAGEPPYAAVVAAAELSAATVRPLRRAEDTVIHRTSRRSGLASAVVRSATHRTEATTSSSPITTRDLRGGPIEVRSGSHGEHAGSWNDSVAAAAAAGDAPDSMAEEDEEDRDADAPSTFSRAPFSLGGVRWGALFSTIALAGGAAVTAQMPAAQQEWLGYLAMLLNTAVVVARRVSGVPTDPLYVPAMAHNGSTPNCFSFIVGHAFTQFRLPRASSQRTLSPRRHRAGGNGISCQAEVPLASYEHGAHSSLAHVVFLNCSDGWDRTPQVSVLAQLLLDPYYRTVEGLCILLEREMVAFGHPAQRRSTAIPGNADAYSTAPPPPPSVPPQSGQTASGERAGAATTATAVPAIPTSHLVARGEMAAAPSDSGSDGGVNAELEQPSAVASPAAGMAAENSDVGGVILDGDDGAADAEDDVSSLLLDTVTGALDNPSGTLASGSEERVLHRWLQHAFEAVSSHGMGGGVSPQGSQLTPVPRTSTAFTNESAPILAQLLDAIRQLVVLYPACFEFTESFVGLLLDLWRSGLVSTFGVNSEQQAAAQGVALGALSLSQWCALLLSTTITATAAGTGGAAMTYTRRDTNSLTAASEATTVQAPAAVYVATSPPSVPRSHTPCTSRPMNGPFEGASTGTLSYTEESFQRLDLNSMTGSRQCPSVAAVDQLRGGEEGDPAASREENVGSAPLSQTPCHLRDTETFLQDSVTAGLTAAASRPGMGDGRSAAAAALPRHPQPACCPPMVLPDDASCLHPGLFEFDYTTRWTGTTSSEASSLPVHTAPPATSPPAAARHARSFDALPRPNSDLIAPWCPTSSRGDDSDLVPVVDDFRRRLLPISYAALHESGYLNKEFSLRYNRLEVGPLIDFVLPSQLTLWKAAYTRHSFWGARQHHLQHAMGQWQRQQQRDQRARRSCGISSPPDIEEDITGSGLSWRGGHRACRIARESMSSLGRAPRGGARSRPSFTATKPVGTSSFHDADTRYPPRGGGRPTCNASVEHPFAILRSTGGSLVGTSVRGGPAASSLPSGTDMFRFHIGSDSDDTGSEENAE